jgi:hypothetical protein
MPTHPHSQQVNARIFVRLLFLSFAGFAFFYTHLFFGLFNDSFLLKAAAVLFLLATLPLPMLADADRKLFPALRRRGKNLLTYGSMIILMHHALMTFLFVLFLGEKV